jgi:hypothetical protein
MDRASNIFHSEMFSMVRILIHSETLLFMTEDTLIIILEVIFVVIFF